MKRCLAALLAAIVVSGPSLVAAAPPETASPDLRQTPFETVPLPTPVARPHKAAYACMAAGAGMIASSFWLADRADTAYDRYLTSRVPTDIRRWFDEATRYDQWSSGVLLGGEALVATGLYLRFLRRPTPPVAVLLGPGACAVSYRF